MYQTSPVTALVAVYRLAIFGSLVDCRPFKVRYLEEVKHVSAYDFHFISILQLSCRNLNNQAFIIRALPDLSPSQLPQET